MDIKLIESTHRQLADHGEACKFVALLVVIQDALLSPTKKGGKKVWMLGGVKDTKSSFGGCLLPALLGNNVPWQTCLRI